MARLSSALAPLPALPRLPLPPLLPLLLLLLAAAARAQVPTWPATWDTARSTYWYACRQDAPIDPMLATNWRVVVAAHACAAGGVALRACCGGAVPRARCGGVAPRACCCGAAPRAKHAHGGGYLARTRTRARTHVRARRSRKALTLSQLRTPLLLPPRPQVHHKHRLEFVEAAAPATGAR